MEKIQKKVEHYIEAYHMLDGVENVVAGVSGGADSMCMLNILLQLRERYGYHLTVVHIHHGIRGQSADEDMEYVEKFCGEKKIEFFGFHYKVEELAKVWHMSDEEAGRKIRYEAFEKILGQNGGGKIAVAHNSGDSSETFLFQLFRGSGIKGLTGIAPVRENIIRPILCLDREEILEYLCENGIDYRTDETNRENHYSRNKIRNELLPYISQNINEKAAWHIRQTAEALGEIETYLEKQTDQAWQDIAEYKEGECWLDREKLNEQDIVIRKRICRRAVAQMAGKLKDITSVHIDIVLDIIRGESGRKADLPYGLEVYREYGKIGIAKRKKQEKDGQICIDCNMEGEDGKKIRCDRGAFFIKKIKNMPANRKIQEKMYTKWMDYDILKSTFQIRTRRPGDYIVVNQEGGRKKLKDYFIDLKIPREERDRILLVAEGSEVFWVVGYRISERVRITEKTGSMLQIEYIHAVAGI